MFRWRNCCWYVPFSQLNILVNLTSFEASQTGQAAADAFNAALGVSATSSGAVATQATASTAAAAATATAAATASTSAAAAATAAATDATSSTAATSGTNVQTFTGTLGGAAPPVIETSGDRPFAVNGATFVNKAAAIQRSCAVQNNACADAVNSGQLAGKSVSDCNAQEDQCNAAA